MDDAGRRTIDYLRSLPEDRVVRWSTYHLSSDEPWTSRWVDIRIEEDDAPPMGWAWTIIGEDDPDGTSPDRAWQFIWPYDLDVHEVWEPPRPPSVLGEKVDAWAVGRGASAPREVAEALARGPERRHVVLGGWSAGTLGRALASWAAEHAGRTDLRFEWRLVPMGH